MAAIDVRVPRPGTAKDSREWENYLNDLYERTGAEVDKVDAAMSDNTALQAGITAAQADADAAQASANTAIADAATAQTAADDAQADADTAIASAAAAQATANDVWLTAVITDIDADGSSVADGRMNIVSPVAGTVTLIYTVINSAVTNATVITTSISGTPITDGAVTIGALSVQGDVDSATPSAANTVAVGNVIKVSSDGAAGATCKANILMKITRA